MSTVRYLYSEMENEKSGMIVKAILLLLVTTLTFFLLLRRSAKKLKNLPPGPRGMPLLGYLPFMGADLHTQFAKLAGVYGPIFKIGLGSKLCVVINSSSLIKEVLRDQDIIFSNRWPTVAGTIASLGGEDITFRDYGPDWMRLRKIFVHEMMGKTILDSLYAQRKEQVKKSVKQIYENVGKQVDIGEMTFQTAMKSVICIMLGDSFQEDEVSFDIAELRDRSAEIMFLLGKTNISDVLPSLAWLDAQGIKKDMEKCISSFEALLDSVVQQRKREMVTPQDNGKTRKDFMQFLLELHQNQDAESSITLKQLKGLLLDTVVGGTDTVSTTVEWAMAELLMNPKLMKKVQEELQQVVGSNNEVEEFHLSKLTYLDAVFKETLRMHPPLPFGGPRSPSKIATVGGYNIPEGSTIFLNLWAIHRDPNNWKNPHEFRPERFMESIDAGKFELSGNNFNFLPFGSGRRGCPGISLAERMSKHLIATFLHLFDWEFPEGGNIKFTDKFGIVMKTMEPVIAVPTPRFSDSKLYV